MVRLHHELPEPSLYQQSQQPSGRFVTDNANQAQPSPVPHQFDDLPACGLSKKFRASYLVALVINGRKNYETADNRAFAAIAFTDSKRILQL